MDMCLVCPFRGHPTIIGASVKTGHTRFCELLDPNHESYNPEVETSYREITARLNDVNPEDCGVLTTRYHKREPAPPIPPIPPGVSVPKPDKLPKLPSNKEKNNSLRIGASREPMRLQMHPDNNEHQTIYEAATHCSHKKSVEACCGSREKCGEGGMHSGEMVSIGICYPCSAERLGINLP